MELEIGMAGGWEDPRALGDDRGAGPLTLEGAVACGHIHSGSVEDLGGPRLEGQLGSRPATEES